MKSTHISARCFRTLQKHNRLLYPKYTAKQRQAFGVFNRSILSFVGGFVAWDEGVCYLCVWVNAEDNKTYFYSRHIWFSAWRACLRVVYENICSTIGSKIIHGFLLRIRVFTLFYLLLRATTRSISCDPWNSCEWKILAHHPFKFSEVSVATFLYVFMEFPFFETQL